MTLCLRSRGFRIKQNAFRCQLRLMWPWPRHFTSLNVHFTSKMGFQQFWLLKFPVKIKQVDAHKALSIYMPCSNVNSYDLLFLKGALIQNIAEPCI